MTMQASRSFKLALLKQMLIGFQLSGVSAQSMSLYHKKNSIKLSADLAMAIARGGRRKWSRALIDSMSKDEHSRSVVKCILGKEYEKLVNKPCCSRSNLLKIPRCKKIVRRSFAAMSSSKRRKNLMRSPRDIKSSIVAKTLVEKRNQVLRKLVPGGESLNDSCLLEETLDYVVALKAQVDLMQCLVKAFETSKIIAQKSCEMQEEKVLSIGQ